MLGQVTAGSNHGATVAQPDSSGATSRNILCRGGRIGRVTDMGLHIRAALVDDLPFIQRMLYEAANRPGEDWPAFEASIQERRNARFWRDWM